MEEKDTVCLDLIAVVREYCAMIDHRFHEAGNDGWLAKMAELLPRLHFAVSSVQRVVSQRGRIPRADLEARFELYSRLKAALGDRDSYWLEFDVAVDGQAMSGSLADDLTDIYCELKQGLEILERQPNRLYEAIGTWETGYRLHWGQHLVDAERHLYNLQASNQLAD